MSDPVSALALDLAATARLNRERNPESATARRIYL
jgi:hypothetical protein